MDTRGNLVIANGNNITADVRKIVYNSVIGKYDVTFQTGAIYHYNYSNILWYRKPQILCPRDYRISNNGRELFNISAIYCFNPEGMSYYLICFLNGTEKLYRMNELEIECSCLSNKNSKDVFAYLSRIADNVGVETEDGKKFLSNQYSKIDYIGESSALATYLMPERFQLDTNSHQDLIFPFGCNASQYAAVERALKNQISVIEGPPGTGKTLTILNIISNLIITGKTVLVVSYNNSAIKNIVEKLNKYGLDFVVALLGNRDNKAKFIANQQERYPDMKGWELQGDREVLQAITEQSKRLRNSYEKKEKVAQLKLELQRINTEFEHYKKYNKNCQTKKESELTYSLESVKLMQFLQQCERSIDRRDKIGLFLRLMLRFRLGKNFSRLAKNNGAGTIAELQRMYYETRTEELKQEIALIKKELEYIHFDTLLEEYCANSFAYLRNYLSKHYENSKKRPLFQESDLFRTPKDVLNEYPVILSTTASALSSMGKSTVFDYVIMDEASQVDIASGALALACARNAVIVGDTKQLPNVISRVDYDITDTIFKEYNIDKNYNYAQFSFLQSVCNLFPRAPRTLLKEHYRCHPKIIQFCNQKFYNGQLIVMTEDKGEKDVLTVRMSASGEHARGRVNRRQVDIIQEIIPTLHFCPEQIGIVTPYRDQVQEIQDVIPNNKIDVATVHKFQGREKQVIILSTVDNKPTQFSDDPYLLNVAISRAQEQLLLVVPEEAQTTKSNISDLISYIKYNNFEVSSSKLSSVFDYLYSKYSERRIAYLKKHTKISKYDSENLMYAMICDVLKELNIDYLGVLCHHPLKMLIRDMSLLNKEEREFVSNPATHTDFLIYNKISKKPILVIEVDGYWYHKKGTKQADRDRKKNRVLQIYNIPYLRFATNGSGEKEKLKQQLQKLV